MVHLRHSYTAVSKRPHCSGLFDSLVRQVWYWARLAAQRARLQQLRQNTHAAHALSAPQSIHLTCMHQSSMHQHTRAVARNVGLATMQPHHGPSARSAARGRPPASPPAAARARPQCPAGLLVAGPPAEAQTHALQRRAGRAVCERDAHAPPRAPGLPTLPGARRRPPGVVKPPAPVCARAPAPGLLREQPRSVSLPSGAGQEQCRAPQRPVAPEHSAICSYARAACRGAGHSARGPRTGHGHRAGRPDAARIPGAGRARGQHGRRQARPAAQAVARDGRADGARAILGDRLIEHHVPAPDDASCLLARPAPGRARRSAEQKAALQQRSRGQQVRGARCAHGPRTAAS